VDRLDYTKGLVTRLTSVGRMFQKYPQWVGKVIFIQVAVPSRTDVEEYKDLKENIDRLVGNINGKFSTHDWSPIR
jgi:trehalose 6-phosphate synthase/phosphatase